MYSARRSIYTKIPKKKWVNHPLDWWLNQYFYIPMSANVKIRGRVIYKRMDSSDVIDKGSAEVKKPRYYNHRYTGGIYRNKRRIRDSG